MQIKVSYSLESCKSKWRVLGLMFNNIEKETTVFCYYTYLHASQCSGSYLRKWRTYFLWLSIFFLGIWIYTCGYTCACVNMCNVMFDYALNLIYKAKYIRALWSLEIECLKFELRQQAHNYTLEVIVQTHLSFFIFCFFIKREKEKWEEETVG